MKENDIEVFNSRICKFCLKQAECSKNEFSVYGSEDKRSLRCINYEYNNEKMEESILLS